MQDTGGVCVFLEPDQYYPVLSVLNTEQQASSIFEIDYDYSK